ncbi:MAG TPA: right-handed parallel beta-helix repeat-containing protein [Candidatus Dormibacteraeota bacterium]|nr:right-handed parallel beta-helix repeat-containing protein [Candidatus Dormibacteraeota bacterium]
MRFRSVITKVFVGLGVFFFAMAVLLTCVPSFAASELVVPTQFPTVQSAVDAALPGDTVEMLSGTYQEQVTIGKNLKLVGVGLGPSIIQAPTALKRNAFGSTYIVQINNSAQVSMSRLTVSGPGPGPCGSLNLGILVYGDATLELKDSVVTHIRDNPLSSCFFGAGVGVGIPAFLHGGSVGHATIRDSIFLDYQSEAIGVVGAGSTATISDNVIIGAGNSTARAQNGVFVTSSAVATITDNIISRNLCDIPNRCGNNPMGQGQSSGIFANNAGAGTIISDNKISDNDVGIYLFRGSNCCKTEDNRLKNNRFFGLIIQDGDNTASENRISGGEVGIGVVADFVNVTGTLIDNHISKTSVKAIQELSCCGVKATAIVRD